MVSVSFHSLCNLDTNPLSDLYFLKIFPHSWDWCFYHGILHFSFMRFHLLIVVINAGILGSWSNEFRWIPYFLFYHIQSIWSLMHLQLIFVKGDKYGSVFTLQCELIQFDQNHSLKILSLIQYIFLASLLKISYQ